MPTPGYVFRDSGTTPEVEAKEDEKGLKFEEQPSQPDSPKSPLEEGSTESHALATAEHEMKGASQHAGEKDDLTDLGWRTKSKEIPTLVGGLPNEELWTLIRRFNKQLYHVKAIDKAPPGGLDLFTAEEDEFSPDKLRSTIERLYMTVIVGLISFGKHIARLRSWREPRRTAAFCTVYSAAWLLNLLVPTVFLTTIVLIVIPQSRPLMFPPAPIALVSAKTGGAQKPKAGVLGSHDSVTGAPEKHQGEAVEQEASNFVSGIANVAISSAAGKHEQGSPDDDPVDSNIPDPTNIAGKAADLKNSAVGEPVHHDKTKEPMQDAMWKQMRPIMHALGDVTDVWERLGNALSPTPPFSRLTRVRFASLLIPGVLVSLFITSSMVMKGTTFGIGFAFFGDPLISRGITILNEKVPNWQQYLELRNTLLKGVPTNAQLAITLLRIGEANRAPLPPPPSSDEAPPDKPAALDKDALTSNLDASHSDVEDLITPDEPSSTNQDQQSEKEKKKSGSRVLSVFKNTTAAGIETKLGSDRVRALAGSSNAKQHLGILPKKRTQEGAAVEGPIEFLGRYQGKKGGVYIDSSISPRGKYTNCACPCVYFTRETMTGDESLASKTHEPVWALPVADIIEVKKVGGIGWKGKLVVGWAMERQVKEGIEIVGKDGKRWKVMALKERDELFDRLISIGGQIWESW